MNGMSRRDAAFLAEMGITPLWHVRAGAPAAEAESEAEFAAEAESGADAALNRVAATVSAEAAGSAAPVTVRLASPPASTSASASASASTSATVSVPAAGADSAWVDAPAPAPTPPTDADIAQMDWHSLNAAIAGCTRCACKGARKPVPGNGARSALWLVAAGATTAADENERQPVADDPGRLLANMLAAVQRSRAENVYVTNLVKCRPTSANGAERAPSADEAVACRPYLERELVLCGAATVLTLGQIAANALLDQALQTPLAGARGSVHRLGGVALVATLHPGELLRRGADKALAWADLCLAKSADAAAG